MTRKTKKAAPKRKRPCPCRYTVKCCGTHYQCCVCHIGMGAERFSPATLAGVERVKCACGQTRRASSYMRKVVARG